MKTPFTLLFALSLPLLGQGPPPPGTTPVPTPVPAPGAQPDGAPAPGAVDPARRVALDPNAIAIPAQDSILRPNMTGLEAAQLYEDHSGKRVILSTQISQSEVAFVMRGPLTHAEIARFLKLTLLGEGLALIPVPGEPDLVRMVPSGAITSPGPIPKDYYTDQFNLPAEDQLVTYQMVFKYLKPEEAEKVFQSVVGQFSASGNIAAVPNASSLIITENASLIKQLIKIKESIDVPTPVTEKWVEVVYGDAEAIAERMNEIYNEQSNARQTTRTTRANVPPAPGTGGATGGTSAGEDVPIKIIGVRRTSRILLVGKPADLVSAAAMVKSFDQPSSDNNRQVFRLRYLPVIDFLPIAQQAIEVDLGDSDGAGGGGGRSSLAGQNQNSRNNISNRNTGTNNSSRNSRTTGQGGAGGGAGGSSLSGGAIFDDNVETAPEAFPVGKTLLVGNYVSNTIIVTGPPHHIELVRNLISDLDTESQQIALSAVVGSYALTDDMNFGVDLARAIRDSGSSFLAGGAAAFGGSPSNVLNPSVLSDLGTILTANGVAGNGVSIYGSINDDFSIFVNALETKTDFKTLERSVLTTRNNRSAVLSTGQEIAIPSSTFSGNVNGGQSTNVEYRDVTLELKIQPLINDDNQVSLEISLERRSVGANRPIGELLVPDINKESLSTSVTVVDGSAVILGGVITTQNRNSKSGIPILSSIPGIGRLFGRTNDNGAQSELIVMIQPRILNSQGDLNHFRDDYERNTVHSRETREAFPAGRSVLPVQGTMPEYDPAPKGGVLPQRRVQQRPVAAPAPAPAPERRRRKIGGRSGRPGSR